MCNSNENTVHRNVDIAEAMREGFKKYLEQRYNSLATALENAHVGEVLSGEMTAEEANKLIEQQKS